MSKLPERLLALRSERGLSQKGLVEKMGFALNTYVRYERGERVPDADALIRIADFYGVTLDYLVGRAEERTYPHYMR